MADLQSIQAQGARALQDAARLLAGLDAERYGRSRPEIGSEGIGAHVRHVLEFYGCLLDGIADGRVDYDARPREERLETDPAAAAARAEQLAARLTALESDGPLRVIHDRGSDDEEDAASSIARELRFVSSHAVHHYAIVGLILRMDGDAPADDFGVAPSTLRHRGRMGLGSA